MKRLRDIPISTKMRFISIASSMAALTFAFVALFTYQFSTFKQGAESDLQAATQMIANVCAPGVALGSLDGTVEVLRELQAEPDIVCAYIKVRKLHVDKLVASDAAEGIVAEPLKMQSVWVRPGVTVEEDLVFGKVPANGISYTHGKLIAVQPMVVDGEEVVGDLVVISDYNGPLYRMVKMHLLVLALVVGGSVLVSYATTRRLHHLITWPVQALAETARKISASRNYSLQAEKLGADELGDCTDAFNTMLQDIRVSDESLRREIAERKRAESELKDLSEKLLQTSRQAGMAEVATGVLHNIGNVLNSVNVSATMISERLSSPRLEKVVRAVQLMTEQNGSLPKFLEHDPRGKVLPAYLAEASE